VSYKSFSTTTGALGGDLMAMSINLALLLLTEEILVHIHAFTIQITILNLLKNVHAQ
jgi:hypothetical protein